MSTTQILFHTKGTDKRVVRTRSTPLIELKNPQGDDMPMEYPLATAWSSIFERLFGRLEGQPTTTKGTPT